MNDKPTEVKLGEATTVGELRTLLQAFVDEAPIRRDGENDIISVHYSFNKYGGSIILK